VRCTERRPLRCAPLAVPAELHGERIDVLFDRAASPLVRRAQRHVEAEPTGPGFVHAVARVWIDRRERLHLDQAIGRYVPI
jgi:hypothetical protein